MRAVELSFSKESSSVLHAFSPANGKIAPPGWYYLFLLQDNGQGLTPSCARIVRVGSAVDKPAAPSLCGSSSFLGAVRGLAATGPSLPSTAPAVGAILLALGLLMMVKMAAAKRESKPGS
jgi:hypothetical protein